MNPDEYGWHTVPLGDLCDITIGRTPSRSNAAYWGPSHPWVTIADMNGSDSVIDTKETITDTAVAECGCREVQPGTLLMSFKLSIGKLAFAGVPLFTNEAIAALPVYDEQKLESRFLYYALQTLEHDHGSDRAAKGKTLNKAKLEQLPVALPPIEEQRRIMVILDKADAIRSKKRQTITLSNRLIESGFLHFFGDCLNNGKRFPAGTLEQLAGRIVDCPHSTPEYSATETAYFCVRSSDIQDAQINLSQTRFVTSEIYEERVARHVPQAGEVIYTREGGRLGNAAQIPRDVNICLGQRMMLFSAKDKVSTNEFIWALLNSPGIRHQVDSLIAGAAAPRVNIADIRRLEVILPSFELQQQFSRFVQKVRDQRMKSSKSEEELGDLFNSLVQRAFRGEL